MSEDRKRILELLAQGKITADEAERLIAAMSGEGTGPRTAGADSSGPRRPPKYLRVLVDANEEGRPTKVNVRIPMQLLRAGVRLGALIPNAARDQVNEALRENGIGLDISQIKPENLEELIEQLQDFSVDVDDEHAKVRVFCE
jgi:Asp-tRNA(Asn)/Glu-tRNA(Gln) amidotransferase B subunit